MKTLLVVLSVAIAVVVSGCASEKVIDGVNYETYGLLNVDDAKKPCISYSRVTGNIVWSVLLSETVVAPIYFVGFSLYEPVTAIPGCKPPAAK